MEVVLTLNCSDYSESIVDILNIFQQIGWNIYNSEGKVEFLPIGNDDDYNWQCEKISESSFRNIIANKIDNREQVGVNLFYNNGNEGISLLAYDTKHIMLNVGINRKTIDGRHTDMIWYLENIIYKFYKIGVRILSYKIEEFED